MGGADFKQRIIVSSHSGDIQLFLSSAMQTVLNQLRLFSCP